MSIKISINGQPYEFNDATEYISFLSKLLNECEKRKNMKEDSSPKVQLSSVTIGKPAEPAQVKEEAPLKPKLVGSFAEGTYPAEVKEVETKTPVTITKKRKKVNYSIYNQLIENNSISQLLDNELLTKQDLAELKNAGMLFVSGTTSNKEESYFQENVSLLNKMDIPTAAFISGQALSMDKLEKEVKKVNKMCSSITTNVVCYEVNNEGLEELQDSRDILDAFRTISKITSVLHGSYTPLLCIDLANMKKITPIANQIKEEQLINCPMLVRVSSKDLDNVSEKGNYVIMHPGSKHDQIVGNETMKNYINGNQKTSSVKLAA